MDDYQVDLSQLPPIGGDAAPDDGSDTAAPQVDLSVLPPISEPPPDAQALLASRQPHLQAISDGSSVDADADAKARAADSAMQLAGIDSKLGAMGSQTDDAPSDMSAAQMIDASPHARLMASDRYRQVYDSALPVLGADAAQEYARSTVAKQANDIPYLRDSILGDMMAMPKDTALKVNYTEAAPATSGDFFNRQESSTAAVHRAAQQANDMVASEAARVGNIVGSNLAIGAHKITEIPIAALASLGMGVDKISSLFGGDETAIQDFFFKNGMDAFEKNIETLKAGKVKAEGFGEKTIDKASEMVPALALAVATKNPAALETAGAELFTSKAAASTWDLVSTQLRNNVLAGESIALPGAVDAARQTAQSGGTSAEAALATAGELSRGTAQNVMPIAAGTTFGQKAISGAGVQTVLGLAGRAGSGNIGDASDVASDMLVGGTMGQMHNEGGTGAIHPDTQARIDYVAAQGKGKMWSAAELRNIAKTGAVRDEGAFEAWQAAQPTAAETATPEAAATTQAAEELVGKPVAAEPMGSLEIKLATPEPAAAPFTPEERHQARLDNLMSQVGDVTDEQRQAITDYHGEVPRDQVTGAYGRPELVPSIAAARDSGEPSSYGEVDMRGLGGGNAHLGSNSAMDPHLAAFHDILNQHAQNAAEEAGGQAVVTRKGGDEFGVIGKGIPQDVLENHLTNARAEVTDYAKANGLDTYPGKDGAEPGMGMHYGTSEIAPAADISNIISRADTLVEARKKGAGYEQRGQNEPVGTEQSVDSAGFAGVTRQVGEAPAQTAQADAEGNVGIVAPAADAASAEVAAHTGTAETIPGETQVAADANTQGGDTGASGRLVGVDAAAHEAATSPLNDKTPPTPAQASAGNYAKGHVRLQGLDISIENPRGSTRSGVDENGKPWSRDMRHHYGYIKGTLGADGAHVDTILGEHPENPVRPVFVVYQKNGAGGFDEHKVMLGFKNQRDAERAYLSEYPRGWDRMGDVKKMSSPEFKDWLKNGAREEAQIGVVDPNVPRVVTRNQQSDAVAMHGFTSMPTPAPIGMDGMRPAPLDLSNASTASTKRTTFDAIPGSDHTHETVERNLYDADNDPRGLYDAAKASLIKRGLPLDHEHMANEFERQVVQNGFDGYRTNSLADVKAAYVAGMKDEIGWDQYGGRLLRQASDQDMEYAVRNMPGATLDNFEHEKIADKLGAVRGTGDVIGRTTWVPKMRSDNNGTSGFWKGYRDKEGGNALTISGAHAAFDKAAKGEKLTIKEQRFMDHVEKTAQDYTEQYAEEMAAHQEASIQASRDTPYKAVVLGHEVQSREVDHGNDSRLAADPNEVHEPVGPGLHYTEVAESPGKLRTNGTRQDQSRTGETNANGVGGEGESNRENTLGSNGEGRTPSRSGGADVADNGDGVGTSNEETTKLAEKLQMEKPAKMRAMTMPEYEASAHEELRRNPNRGAEIAAEVAKNPRPLDGTEEAILAMDRKRLDVAHKTAAQEALDAFEAHDGAAESAARARMKIAEDSIAENMKATQNAGTIWHEGGMARQMLAAEDMSLSRMLVSAKLAAGRELTAPERASLEKAAKIIEEADAHLNPKEAAPSPQKRVPRMVEMAAKDKFDKLAGMLKAIPKEKQMNSSCAL